MIERHEQLRDVLLEIAKEIPKEKIRYPPKLPTYDENLEYPEKRFEHTLSGIMEELPKRYKGIFKSEIPKKKEIKLLDKEYEMLILEKKNNKPAEIFEMNAMKFTGISGSNNVHELIEASKDDLVMTTWEKECKKLRVIKRLFEQDSIIEEMDASIREFDETINILNEERYQVEIDIEFLELFVLTLHQEVLILKKFEAAEEEKENKLFNKLRERHETQKKLNEINSKVEGRNREIRRCEEEIKNLETMFHSTTADNKFYDFLRRIFKKKYRPPKVKTEDSDSESETESSSSSEEEDAKSLDSKDLGPIRLDESVCPPGCDPNLYDWTFTQRSARHTLELNIMEEKKQIESLRKENDTLVKKIRRIEGEYQVCKDDLEEYVRDKQRNLNEVNTVVVLRLNQIQNFKTEYEIENLSESVLFPSLKLTSLNKRIVELDKETQMEKQKHEKNRLHLTRIKIDVQHMKKQISNLTKEIEEEMIRKFGSKVNMDDIEESLLKRLVAEMHSIILELDRNFEKKLKETRDKLIEKENQYVRKLQENTDKNNLLTVLQEQKTKIRDEIERQSKMLCYEVQTNEELDEDIENLKKITKSQQLKIDELKAEIALLRLKVKPKPPFVKESEFLINSQIKSCEESLEQIDEKYKEELRSMFEEAKEILKDIKSGNVHEFDEKRMRKLTSDMLEKLPETCKEKVVSVLVRNSTIEEPLSKQCARGILIEIIRTLSTESFIEAMTTVKEVLESIFAQFEMAAFESMEAQ